jgi:UPF0755 protein
VSGFDWHDPFAQEQADVERERRRAEREARRRSRQQSLGEKVEASRDGDSEASVAAPVSPPQPAAPAPAQSPPAVADPASAPPAGPPAPPVAPPAAPGRSAGPPRDTLLARRVLGLVALIGALVLAYFGVKAVKGVFEDDPPPAAPVKPAKVSELTIPEGLDRRQIADLAKEQGLKGDYERASKDFKGFDLAKYGAQDAPNLEGFLFPATYELPKKGTVNDLVSRQLDAFRANLAEVDLSYAKSRNLNVYDVLKIASMIEREIQVPEERKMAAAVIYNRLKAGTPLGIDATIRYEDQNYDEQILASRLAEQTPYNTRLNPGLPPTPIGNPGLASIEAAANPAKSDAFFFVVKPGTCGEHVFVESQAEFDDAEAAYQQALQEQGGSPTEC